MPASVTPLLPKLYVTTVMPESATEPLFSHCDSAHSLPSSTFFFLLFFYISSQNSLINVLPKESHVGRHKKDIKINKRSK
jgi:hypothetical protein